jgi:cell division protein FtsI/penicillin-binding protein 2
MSKGFASNYRIFLVAAGLVACFAGLGTRLVWLHVVDREAWLASIARTRRQLIVEEAKRGDILDRHNNVLATSRPQIVVAVDPWMVDEQQSDKWPQLAALVGLTEADLLKAFTTKFRAPAPVNPAPAAPTAAAPADLVFNSSPTPSAPTVPGTSATAATDDNDDSLDPVAEPDGRRKRRWVRLAEVTEAAYVEIEKLGIRGLCPPQRTYRRVYPNNQLAAHILGFVNHAQEPASGIEACYDFYLRGHSGWRVGERDGRGRELAQFRLREVPRSDGYNVKLTLDATVQDIIEQELAAIAHKYQPLKATIIVSDPRDGMILGLANYPTFNLNEFNRVPAAEMARMKNVAVADVYEPGSVFKIVAASGALQEGLAQPDDTFDCGSDRVEYKGRTLRLPADDHHFPNPSAVPVRRIISFSSNRGAARLGMLLGEEKMYRYVRAFGFGSRLGFPVGGEVAGILRPLDKWDPIDITRVPMGHTISATVLQMHQAMSAIANGGVLLRPQIVSQVTDPAGEVVYAFGRVELGRAVSERTARTMAQMLTAVASKEGTAPEAAIRIGDIDYEVAGKTGTTQKLLPVPLADGTTVLRYSEQHHIASFVGFFPSSRPQVAISVVVDDADAHAPGGVAYGAKIAAPSFRSIGEKLITVLDIKPAGSSTRFTFAAEGGRR